MSTDLAASALRWWQEAGVDTLVAEEPRNWLNSNAATAAPDAGIAPAEPLPATLAAFQPWLMESDAVPLAGPGSRRVGPSGDPDSGLMVLVDMPSADDVAGGRLLGGEAGALFDRMMAAIDRNRESLYLAPLSPVRTPTGRLPAASHDRLAEIARHHIGLVAPQALLLFGDACAGALLGGPVSRTRGRWHEIATPAGPVRTLATLKPENLLSQPGLKKHAWEDLQLLREGLKP